MTGSVQSDTAVRPDTAELLNWYRQMLEIRGFEQRVTKLCNDGLVRASTHLATGQEAVAVGAAAALGPDDKVLATYRGHHHCLAKGMDPAAAFAEILGRATGVCGGKGGSMHLTDVSKNLYGCYAIVGAHLPIAVGMAWAAKVRSTSDVTVVFFGDGTTTIGAFHEALGLAAVWTLPIVFVCENNGYSEYTPIADVSPVSRPAADRASAYGLEGIVVDGNDVGAVHDAMRAALDSARNGNGPVLIECETYRHGGHSRTDPGTSRPKEEVAAWFARDPIAALERDLVTRNLEAATLETIKGEVDAMLDMAVAAAVDAPPPDLSELHADVLEEVAHG